MSKNEMLTKIEMLNHYEAMAAEFKKQADAIRDDIKAEMLSQNTETLIVDRYIVRWVDVLSQRFDSTSFKRVCPDLYRAYVKQVASRRFSISQ